MELTRVQIDEARIPKTTAEPNQSSATNHDVLWPKSRASSRRAESRSTRISGSPMLCQDRRARRLEVLTDRTCAKISEPPDRPDTAPESAHGEDRLSLVSCDVMNAWRACNAHVAALGLAAALASGSGCSSDAPSTARRCRPSPGVS